MRRFVTRRRVFAVSGTIIALVLTTYLAMFFTIRARAYRDYEYLRTSGEWPGWRRHRATYPYEDGGSVGHQYFGYELIKIRRLVAYPQPEHVERAGRYPSEHGFQLQFTCRAWFPLLQKFMADREEISSSDEDQQSAGMVYLGFNQTEIMLCIPYLMYHTGKEIYIDPELENWRFTLIGLEPVSHEESVETLLHTFRELGLDVNDTEDRIEIRPCELPGGEAIS